MSKVFSNINLFTLYDTKRKKIRVRPTEGQNIPQLWVSCSRKQRTQMTIGTTFKMDVKLIESEKRKPYLVATKKILGQLSLF
jgi:predicted Ser/Thr protein kinase